MSYKKFPTAEEIEKFVSEFPTDNSYDNQNYNVSLKVAKKFFENTYENIFVKVNFINGAFKTGIGDTMGVAVNIFENVKNLDTRLAEGDKKLINEIAKWKSKKTKAKRNNHSFATKFCHCHYPKLFPINDQYVRYSLIKFNKALRFSDHKASNIKNNYKNFCEMLDAFNGKFKKQFDYSTLDRYLWALARTDIKRKNAIKNKNKAAA